MKTTYALLVLLALCACKKYNNDYNDPPPPPPPPTGGITFSGDFVKSSNSVVTQATGSVTASLDTTTRQLSYVVSWNYLSSDPNGMHFHDDGPIIANIEGFPVRTDGSVSGTVTLTAAQVADLNSGKIYAQIHTANYIPGEILAHLARH